jgi:parallel beta-helix repeat protein
MRRSATPWIPALLGAAAALLPAGAARAQVACGDTVTGKVTLTGDLTCPDTGLAIGADKTKLDLGGFTLRGNPGTVGIDNGGGFDGVTIENGRIEEFDEGISIGGDAQKNVVRDVVVFASAADGIDLNDSDLARITNALVTGNGAAGIQIGSGATGNLVDESFAIGNVAAGIQIEGDGNTVRSSEATANAEGILVLGSGNSISGSRFYINTAEGVRVEGDDNQVTKSYAKGNFLEGIEVKGGAGAKLDKNESSGNREVGIFVAADSDGASVSKNTTAGNYQSGIVVEGDCDGARVERNRSSGNLLAGIETQNASTTLRKNTADGNLGRGITAPVGVFDGGGNKASHNPDEDCSPSVSCN